MMNRKLYEIFAKSQPEGRMSVLVVPGEKEMPPAYSELGLATVSRALLQKALLDHRQSCRTPDCQTEKIYKAAIGILDIMMPGNMGEIITEKIRRE